MEVKHAALFVLYVQVNFLWTAKYRNISCYNI